MSLTDRVGDFIIVVGLMLFLLNVGGLLYNYFTGSTIQFGVSIYLAMIFVLGYVIVALIRKTAQPITRFSRDDWILLVISILFVIGVIYVAPKLAPSIFSTANVQLQSVVGI